MSRTGVARTQSNPSINREVYDSHRFDNYTAWLDLQERAEKRSRKVFFSEDNHEPVYGYSELPAPAQSPERTKSPFRVKENSFTSSTVVTRQYDKSFSLSTGQFDSVRTDPFHYPNAIATTQGDHWEDHRSGNRNPFFVKPSLMRPLDKELRDAVPDSAVKQLMHSKAMGGKISRPMDVACANILFGNGMKPSPRKEEKEPAARDWSSFCPKAAPAPPKPTRPQPATSYKVRVTDTFDDRKSHLRCQGGLDAQRGFAGTWSVEHGHGTQGISQFALTPQPLMSFW